MRQTVLLRRLLDPIYRDGVVLDGFPRTPVQVECLKRFYHKMLELRQQFYETRLAEHFPRAEDDRNELPDRLIEL